MEAAAGVEPAPAMDASRPTALRLWGFLLSAVGALAAGIASALTWVTVGLRGQASVTTDIRGIDIADGKIVLGGAVAILVGVIATRMVTGTARRIVAIAVVVAALVVIVVSGAFLVRAKDQFGPVDSDALIQKIADVTGQPAAAVGAHMDQVVAQIGGFTDLGLGPWIALGGGLVATAGGALVVAWSRRTPEEPVPDDLDETSEPALD